MSRKRLGHIGCTFLALLCSSCALPMPHDSSYRVAPGDLRIIKSGTQEEIPAALILAIESDDRRGEHRLVHAFIFHPGDAFPMYYDRGVDLLGPEPLPLSKHTSNSFLVVAPGYAPKFFGPEPKREKGIRVDWPLRGLSKPESRTTLERLRTMLDAPTIDTSAQKEFDDDDEGKFTSQYVNERATPITVKLSEESRSLAKSFIETSIAGL